MAVQLFKIPSSGLTAALSEEVGYHGTCWLDLTDDGFVIDQDVPAPLEAFVTEVAKYVRANRLPNCVAGVAYMRVIDGAMPENDMRWHTDNADGGVRFHTAIATDDARVNLAYPPDVSDVGMKVLDTNWQTAWQPDNGVVVVFTTEPHGVLPQWPRPGQRTIVFFATLYESREVADICNCANLEPAMTVHAALPALEASR